MLFLIVDRGWLHRMGWIARVDKTLAAFDWGGQPVQREGARHVKMTVDSSSMRIVLLRSLLSEIFDSMFFLRASPP